MFKTYVQFICEEQVIYHTQPIEVIVRSVQEGDELAFDSLVARLKNGIEVHIRRIGPNYHDELYQESLIALYRAVYQYDAERCDQFERYYFYKLKFTLIDYMRKVSKDINRPIISLETTMTEEERTLEEMIKDVNAVNPDISSELTDLETRMTPIALQLSPLEYRVLEYLREQMPVKAMAAIENESLKTIYNAIGRLKTKIKAYLKGVS